MRARVTERDTKLPHQINLTFKSGQQSITLVCCNCKDEPLGETSNAGDVWAIYNDPSKHDNTNELFIPRAHHTANAKVFDIE